MKFNLIDLIYNCFISPIITYLISPIITYLTPPIITYLIPPIITYLIPPIITYLFDRLSRNVANSMSDTLHAISILKDDVYSADSGLAVVSRDIRAFVNRGTDLIDDHTRYFSSNKMQLERDWETYGYHFSNNKDINDLMQKLQDELDEAYWSVLNINLSKSGFSTKEVTSYTLYDFRRPEVEKLCSLMNVEKKKLIKK